MPFEDLLGLVNSIIQSIDPDQLSNDTLSELRSIFPEKFIEAALDIIDHRNVLHFSTPWGHTEYEVLGSTATYAVFLDLRTMRVPYSCTCPAFVFSVLMTAQHIMCKHVLATMIARRMRLCSERTANADDLAALYSRQFPSAELVTDENNDGSQ